MPTTLTPTSSSGYRVSAASGGTTDISEAR